MITAHLTPHSHDLYLPLVAIKGGQGDNFLTFNSYLQELINRKIMSSKGGIYNYDPDKDVYWYPRKAGQSASGSKLIFRLQRGKYYFPVYCHSFGSGQTHETKVKI